MNAFFQVTLVLGLEEAVRFRFFGSCSAAAELSKDGVGNGKRVVEGRAGFLSRIFVPSSSIASLIVLSRSSVAKSKMFLIIFRINIICSVSRRKALAIGSM